MMIVFLLCVIMKIAELSGGRASPRQKPRKLRPKLPSIFNNKKRKNQEERVERKQTKDTCQCYLRKREETLFYISMRFFFIFYCFIFSVRVSFSCFHISLLTIPYRSCILILLFIFDIGLITVLSFQCVFAISNAISHRQY